MPMSWEQVFFASAGTALGLAGLIMALARTPPDVAASNLSQWARAVGIHNVPSWLQDTQADKIAREWARRVLIMSATALIGGGALWYWNLSAVWWIALSFLIIFAAIAVFLHQKQALLLFQKRLVVQRMWFQAPNIDSDNILYVNVHVRNVNEDAANLLNIRGNILGAWDMQQERKELAVQPYLKDPTILQIPPHRDFSFTIAQELPSQLVREWQGKKFYLFFNKLEVVTQSAANANISVRLPLWEAAWISREGNGVTHGEIRSIGFDLSNLPIRQ